MSFVNKLNAKEFNELLDSTKTFHFLDFYAEWCGPCMRMMPIIENLAQDEELLGSISFHKINADYNEALSTKFGVRGIPAFFLIQTNENGKYEIIKSWVGTQDPFNLKSDLLLTISTTQKDVKPKIDDEQIKKVLEESEKKLDSK
ncbi:MAG: thioredoxin family protein [Patescibacteria group bacterium]